jgi:hypothetical protein
MTDHDHLTVLLNRLKLTALRDQLDSLIDEAGRRQLDDPRSPDLVLRARGGASRSASDRNGLWPGTLPFVRDLTGFDFNAQPSIDKAQIRDGPLHRQRRSGTAFGIARRRQDASSRGDRPRSHRHGTHRALHACDDACRSTRQGASRRTPRGTTHLLHQAQAPNHR